MHFITFTYNIPHSPPPPSHVPHPPPSPTRHIRFKQKGDSARMLWSANVTSNAELYQNTPAVLPLGDVVVSSDRQVLSLDGLTGKIKGAWGTDDPPVKALDFTTWASFSCPSGRCTH